MDALTPDARQGFLQGITYSNQALPSAIAACVSLGFFLGDWSTHLGAEVNLLRQPFSWTTAIYFGSRLFGLLALVMYMVDVAGGGQHGGCLAVNKLLSAFTMLAVGSSYFLMGLRCSALWGMRGSVVVPVLASATAVTLTYIVHIYLITAAPSPFGSTFCYIDKSIPAMAVSYFGAFVYDSAVAGLTLWPLLKLRSRHADVLRQSPVSRRLLQGTVLYYLAVVSVSVACAIVLVAPTPAYLSATLAAPHVAVTTCMSGRVHLALKQLGASGEDAGGGGSGRRGSARNEKGAGLGLGRGRVSPISSPFAPGTAASPSAALHPFGAYPPFQTDIYEARDLGRDEASVALPMRGSPARFAVASTAGSASPLSPNLKGEEEAATFASLEHVQLVRSTSGVGGGGGGGSSDGGRGGSGGSITQELHRHVG